MKDRINILIIITYVVLLSSISILLDDIREFDYNQFTSFQNWAKSANKTSTWFTSKNAIKWSYYAIYAGLFFWRAYLIYGFSRFVSILNEIEKGNYFSDRNSTALKKIGDIFISYTISVFILRFLLAFIEKSNFDFFQELKAEFTFLLPCGLAFYILAELFERAKSTEEENKLTI